MSRTKLLNALDDLKTKANTLILRIVEGDREKKEDATINLLDQMDEVQKLLEKQK